MQSWMTLDVHVDQQRRSTGTWLKPIDMRRLTAAGDEDEGAAARWTNDGQRVARTTSTTATVAAEAEATVSLQRRRVTSMASTPTPMTRWWTSQPTDSVQLERRKTCNHGHSRVSGCIQRQQLIAVILQVTCTLVGHRLRYTSDMRLQHEWRPRGGRGIQSALTTNDG